MAAGSNAIQTKDAQSKDFNLTISAEKLAAVDPWHWAQMMKVKLSSGKEYTFRNHEYQVEFLQCNARRACCMKATQGGYTEGEVLRTLHGQIYGKYPQGVLYLFPTADEVGEFSKTRFRPFLDHNPFISRQVRNTDSTALKQVGSSFLYLRGARLSQKIDAGVKESGKLRSAPVDKIVCDELDLMSPNAIEKARKRMSHSEVKEERYISNPTIPDYGIHKMFKQSDQRCWYRRCEKCGEQTCAELEFPECVKIRKDGTGYVGCKKCGNELPPQAGEWIPSVPENTDFMVGWHWSQLSSSYVDPAEIIAAYENPPEGNVGDFYRFTLGLPYIDSEARLGKSDVYLSCTGDLMAMGSNEETCMGVDVGKVLHVVIGQKTSDKAYKILKVATCKDWNGVHELAKKFNVFSAVVDSAPEYHSAREFQKSEPYRVVLCRYSEHKMTTDWKDKEGIVVANRTEWCDEVHKLFTESGRIQLPRRTVAIDEYALQMTATAKIPEKDDFTGEIKCRYKKLDNDDHFYHATLYFLLACSRTAPVRPGQQRKRYAKAKNTFVLH